MDIVWQLVQHRPRTNDLLEKFLTHCWEIWKNGNSVRHRGTSRSGKTIARCSMSLVEEYRAANEVAQPLNPSVAVKWHPLDPP